MFISNRAIFLSTLFLIAFFLMDSSSLFAQELEKYRWKNRVLLVFAPDPHHAQLKEQMSLLDANRAGMEERDLKVLALHPEGNANLNPATTKDLYKKFKVDDEAFVVLLIGKDGSEKLRKKIPLTPTELFNTIDAMPMRQSEMRHK